MCLEVLIRFTGQRASYFIGPDRYWNLFDIVVLLYSLFEALTASRAKSYVRFLRVARGLKALVAIRFIRYCDSLQRMTTAAAAVSLSLFWAACLLLIVFFIMSMSMMDTVSTFLEDEVGMPWAQGRQGSGDSSTSASHSGCLVPLGAMSLRKPP